MINQTIDLFQKEQTMEKPDLEIYNYSDTVPPKVFPHVHDFYEIYYLLSDSLTYMIGDKEYQMTKGDFLMIPPGILHYPSDLNIRQGGKYARIVLWFSKEFFERIAENDTMVGHMWDTVKETNSYHIRPNPTESSRLLDVLQRLVAEQHQRKISSDLMTFALLIETLVTINRTVQTMSHFEQHTKHSSLFSHLISYVHEHFAEEVTMESLSKEFYISKSYISKMFREYMGVSVHQYILMLRLEACRKALEEGVPATECFEQFGFKDYSAFYRAFKGAFLMSPSDYQKSVQ